MRKTIGPVNPRESFLVYTVKGVPRGIAVVAFIKAADAKKARERYNGKVIDGRTLFLSHPLYDLSGLAISLRL